MLKVGNGVDQCLRHCLAWKWTKFSPFMWDPFLLSLDKARVSIMTKTVFLKILFLAFSWSGFHCH